MADLAGTIEIVFGSRGLNQLSRDLGTVKGKIGDLSQTATDIANTLLLFSTAVTGLGTALAVGAFNAAKNFESALVDLEKVLTKQEAELLPALKEEIIDLSEKYGQSASEIAQSMANYKQAGFDANEAMELTKVGLDLVIAGGVDASEASELLVASLKGFKEPASEAGRLLDILNEVSNNYATDVQEFGRGMAGISPIASTMGFSMEETAGILTPVIEIFRSGDEAAVALKTGLLKLIDDSAPVAEALESIGVKQKDANGNLRSGKDILHDVATAFTHLDENQKLFVTQQLVGIDQSARMVEVFNGLSASADITATALNASGSAAAEVAKRLETSQIAVDRFGVAWENMLAEIGGKFQVEAIGVINGATEMEQAFRDVVKTGKLDGFFDAVRPQLERVENLFHTVAQNLPAAFEGIDFSRLTSALGNVSSAAGNAFGGIFGNIDLTTIDGLHIAIQKTIDGLGALANVVSGQIQYWQPLWNMIGEGINHFTNMDASSQQTMGTFLEFGRAVASGGILIASAIALIGDNADLVSRAFHGMMEAAGVVVNSIQVSFNLLQTFIYGWLQGLTSLLSLLPGSIGDSFKSVSQGLDQAFKTATQDATKNAEELAANYRGLGENLFGDDPSGDRNNQESDLFRGKERDRDLAQKNQELENRFREKETKAAEARAERYAQGIEISIKADELAPHLESVWEIILERIKVRASEEGAEMLIGVT